MSLFCVLQCSSVCMQRKKVVYLEELASEFNMRTQVLGGQETAVAGNHHQHFTGLILSQDAISRVQSLQDSGEITGVIDDRGKFIHISMEEMEAVAKFIKQRGRVAIAELVSSSNTLINLQPESTA